MHRERERRPWIRRRTGAASSVWVRKLVTVERLALEGSDWGAEAQPKLTEFESAEAVRAMVSHRFDWLV